MLRALSKNCQYTTLMNIIDGIIDHGTNVNIPEMPENFDEKDQGRHTFMAFAGADIVGFDTDREIFLGAYRTYANPEVVESGSCKGSLGYGDNPCGSLQTRIELRSGEEKEFLVILGIGRADVEGKEAVRAYTLTPARFYGRAHELGSLTPGKYADLIVLDRDIFTVDPMEIADTRVEMTVFDGRIVHRRSGY